MMSDARLATDLYVNAYARIAARDGVALIIRRRGDRASGSLILKINLLNGMARVLIEARYHDDLVWTPALPIDPLPEVDAEAYLTRQGSIDPDAWLIEIEDKQGRVWFPGKVVTL